MKSVEIIGFKRANLGKASSKALRLESLVPCVLYGGKDEPVHFQVPMILFRELIYTSDSNIAELNIEGKIYKALLQEVQFHPVNELILHADFLQLFDDKAVKVEVPVKFTGVAPGVAKGGKLVTKLRKVKIKALPGELPDSITVDISGLDLGKTIKVGAIKAAGYEILNPPSVPVVSIDIPRALRGKQGADK